LVVETARHRVIKAWALTAFLGPSAATFGWPPAQQAIVSLPLWVTYSHL